MEGLGLAAAAQTVQLDGERKSALEANAPELQIRRGVRYPDRKCSLQLSCCGSQGIHVDDGFTGQPLFFLLSFPGCHHGEEPRLLNMPVSALSNSLCD